MSMHFDKLDIVSKAAIRKQGSFIALILTVLIVVAYGNSLLDQELARLKKVAQQYKQVSAEVVALNAAVESYKATIQGSKSSLSKREIDSEEFIEFIGKAAAATNCDISTLSGGEQIVEDGIGRMRFKLEVSGNLLSVYKLLQGLDGLNVKYILKDLSLRKQEDFIWLRRDSSSIPVLDWWDISDKGGSVSSGDSNELLTLDTVFGGNTLSLYMDVDFISSSALE